MIEPRFSFGALSYNTPMVAGTREKVVTAGFLKINKQLSKKGFSILGREWVRVNNLTTELEEKLTKKFHFLRKDRELYEIKMKRLKFRK
jgi:hypothetical protein